MSKPNHDYLGRRDADCGCCCVIDIAGLEHLIDDLEAARAQVERVRALADIEEARGCHYRHQQGETDECNACTASRVTEPLWKGAVATCPECGHIHTEDGCTGDPTPSDLWAGVDVAGCDCEDAS